MKTKLTLSLDKAIIEKGRNIARREKKSLSLLVTELLGKEIEKDSLKKKKLVADLYGIAGNISEKTNWKEMIREVAYEKHGK